MRKVFAESRPTLDRVGFCRWSFVKAFLFVLAVPAEAPGVAELAREIFESDPGASLALETLLPELVPITIRPFWKSR